MTYERSRFAKHGLVAFLGILAMPGVAGAQDDQQQEERTVFRGGDGEDSVSGDFKSITLTANPLTGLVGRMSVNIEYLPTVHHAIVINPSVWAIPSALTFVGLEISYHYYAGTRGAEGFYCGPSIGAFSGGCIDCEKETVYGVAFDAGFQHMFRDGLTIGAGFGLAAAWIGSESEDVVFPLPRVLFTLGYSL